MTPSFNNLKSFVFKALSIHNKVKIWPLPVRRTLLKSLVFGDGLVWTTGLTEEITLCFQIPLAYCGRGLSRLLSVHFGCHSCHTNLSSFAIFSYFWLAYFIISFSFLFCMLSCVKFDYIIGRFKGGWKNLHLTQNYSLHFLSNESWNWWSRLFNTGGMTALLTEKGAHDKMGAEQERSWDCSQKLPNLHDWMERGTWWSSQALKCWLFN